MEVLHDRFSRCKFFHYVTITTPKEFVKLKLCTDLLPYPLSKFVERIFLLFFPDRVIFSVQTITPFGKIILRFRFYSLLIFSRIRKTFYPKCLPHHLPNIKNQQKPLSVYPFSGIVFLRSNTISTPGTDDYFPVVFLRKGLRDIIWKIMRLS